MTQRIKLLLLIPHLGGGGAERVIALLAQHLDPLRFRIHLCAITEDAPGTPSLPDWITVHRLHRKRVRHAWLQLFRLIHRVQPDIVLSGMAHLNFLLLALRPFLPRTTRILVRQNTTASSAATSQSARLPYRYLYPHADAIICQSEAMVADLADSFGLPASKLKVLPNPIDSRISLPASCSTEWPADSWPRLLTVGRLSYEKGIDLLLHALPLIQKHFPRIHAIVLGVGPEESTLRRLAHELSLEGAVTFAGFRENLTDYYRAATLFVLPSRFEGMPNALLEAAAAGLPIVATTCSAGLCDLLQGAPGTWLCDASSSESLAETILHATSAFSDATHSPQRFKHAFMAPFELSTAIATYAALIESAVDEARL